MMSSNYIVRCVLRRRYFALLAPLSFPVLDADLLFSSNVQRYLGYLDVIFLS